MNNREAWEYLKSKESVRAAARYFIENFNLEDSEYDSIQYKFRNLKSTRESARKSKDIIVWKNMLFYSFFTTSAPKKRKSEVKFIVEYDITKEIRKPLSQLTTKALRIRLSPLLTLSKTIAEKEEVESQTVAAYTLKLICNESRDFNTSKICNEIVDGTFGDQSRTMPIDKSTFLFDLLEIGKAKYTNFRRLCKSENVVFPCYSKIAEYRNKVALVNELVFLKNDLDVTIGIAISYKRILQHSLLRIFEVHPSLADSHYH